jgi:hypothetical protein
MDTNTNLLAKRKKKYICSAGYLMKKQKIVIIIFSFWLAVICAGMIFLQMIDFEVFFVLAFMGILIIMQLLELKFVQPRYQRYLWYLLGGGAVIFILIIAHKLMSILYK